MTPELENFEALRRLLKLKRYEQPPPGYFNDFSRQVMVRVRAGATDDQEQVLGRLIWEAPWVVRLIEIFQGKPALAGAFGAAVCALLIGGVVYSERMETAPMSVLPPASEVAATPPILPSAFAVSAPSDRASLLSSTNPVIQVGGSLFDEVRINPQTVSFRIGGH